MKNMEKEVYSYNSEYLTCNARPILPIMGEFHFSRYPEGTCFGSTMRKRKVSGISPVEGI